MFIYNFYQLPLHPVTKYYESMIELCLLFNFKPDLCVHLHARIDTCCLSNEE